jgi:hypothetical protein
MSLDVYLTLGKSEIENSYFNEKVGSGIFIREEGSTKEISREEWDRRYPGEEPVTVKYEEDKDNEHHDEIEVFTANITHNLGKMANEAGIYIALWRPEEKEVERASELIRPLSVGLDKLRSNPKRFKRLNPPNGWGDYEGLVDFVSRYLKACIKFPDAKVSVWR